MSEQPTSKEAFQRLVEGNERFIEGDSNFSRQDTLDRREQLASGQAPFAVILGCSDSRVPAELVFDQGLGDLFVIRIAGNVIAPSQIGSIEFAVERFGTPLVIVLGHTSCGAISATVEALMNPTVQTQCLNIGSIVKRIAPSVQELLNSGANLNKDQLISSACKANIRSSVNQLQHSSEFIEEMVEAGKLAIVGAEYDLETGRVNFLNTVE
ncbi:MAG: carbonic anhydrase [Pseudomonadota bacterium]|nr:carbonic anhydrase [Gammaproteobacteria bacterium]MEC8012387.1 carbonic anhydrase [Pseudomonadota bacterium]HBF09830.1 carbonic anhydrase [Gammaproteobacteria bacterium]|tara:strand:+ start:806 stop:1438 length:633 start_codon:yes stop_codon:yes gene_type:complete